MITTTAPSERASARESARAGFTLLETIIAATISTIIMASIVSTFIVFATGSQSVGAYVEMSMDSRKGLEIFARDIRSAEDITSATTTSITVEYPDNSFYDGQIVEYIFDDSADLFSRIEYDKNKNLVSNEVLLDGVDAFAFNFYDPLGADLDPTAASLLLSIKSVQIDAKMLRKISQASATDYIISARFLMRNRPVTL